jgi:ribosomal 50S subunit-recycling heat shock protein
MRLDKFLKVSRIIKRRTVANEACDAAHVTVNGRVAKASYEVKVGDIVEIGFGSRTLKFEIKNVSDNVSKADASEMYTVLE